MNTAYDAMGRVTSQTNPFTAGGTPGPATSIQYDVTNKAVITTLPDGNTVRSDYLGSAVTLTDQVNRKIKRESDGLGRLVKVTEQDSSGSLAQETSYSYSLIDKLTQVNQGNQLRSYKYDARGRLLYERIPEQSATINDGTGSYWTSKYTYTEYSALATKQDARGVVASYGYDALHRVTAISYDTTNASGVATTPAVSLSYDTAGAVSSVTVGSEYTESYSFDSYHRVQAVTRWILGQAYDIRKTYTTTYEYNQGGQLTKLVYPSGQQVAVNHDTIGRLQSLTDNPGDATGYVTGVSYTTAGQVSGLTLGNGVSESYGYDANRLQMTSQTASKSGTTLMSLTYSYQASAGQMGAGSTAGNAGQLMSVSGTINATTESASYTYDNLGRLATANQTSNGSSAQRRFAYDRWGNRTGVWDAVTGGTQIQSISLQQSGGVPTNRLTSVTSGTTVNYSYDAAGNVTNDGAHSYVYDAENRVVSMDSGAAQYRYDQQNRRVRKQVGSVWTHYLWEGGQVIGEYDATTSYTSNPSYQVNSARVDYIYAGSRMAWSRQRASSGGMWTTRYYLSDRLSARVVMDTNGNVVGRQAHLPYGEDFAESGTQEKHHLTHYERDSESGTDYAMRRQYANAVGRFLQVDPMAPRKDTLVALGSIGDPQGLSRYNYSRNDPVNIKDPTGGNLCYGWNVSLNIYDNGGNLVLSVYLGFIVSYCESSGGGGGGGGSNAGEPPKGSPGNPKKMVENFFNRKKFKHCKDVFEAIKLGSSGVTLYDQMLVDSRGVNYVDLQKPENAGLLTQTMAQAGILPPDDRYASLVVGTTGLGPNGKWTGYTDWDTNTIYLGLGWGHNQWDAGAIVVHELLHISYDGLQGALADGPHAFIAKELNITVKPGQDAADAIDLWLANGCKNP